MTPTTALIIAAFVMLTAAVLFGLQLAKASKRADRQARRARVDYLLRYTGGEPGRCVVCGETVELNYTLHGLTIHPTCREGAA
jgi:hypothetical protein